MPVRGIGPFTRATTDAIVRVGRTAGQALDVALSVTRELPAARLRVSADGHTLAEETVDLQPETPSSRAYTGLTATGPYTVELTDSQGTLLLRHTEDQYDSVSSAEVTVGPQVAFRVPPPEHRSEADIAALGDDQELDGQLLVAARTYSDGLARFPDSFALNKAAGRLAVTLKQYRQAIPLLAEGPVAHEQRHRDAVLPRARLRRDRRERRRRASSGSAHIDSVRSVAPPACSSRGCCRAG